MRGPLKIVVHVLVFVAAVLVFYLGLGIGLALNPFIGTGSLGRRGRHRGAEHFVDTSVVGSEGLKGAGQAGGPHPGPLPEGEGV